MPEVHAILSASSSKRWLNCTPSARLEQNFPNESSVYAEEGTAAHALGEYKLRKYLHERVKRPTSEYEDEEMEANTDIYAEFIISTVERIKETCPHPLVMVEERLDYSYLVPSGFGTGDCVISMVADFQDPVDMIPKYVHEWENGYKIVIGIKTGSKENPIMYALRSCYYKMIKKLSDVEQIEHFTGSGLYDREFIEVLRNLDDPTPFLRGIVAELGYRRKEIPYEQPRRRAGKTHNNFYRLYDAAMLSVTSYTKAGLRLATIFGSICAVVSMLIAMVYLVMKLIWWDRFPAGMAPMLIGMLFLGSVQLFFIGFLGEYIMSINQRVMKRPLVIEEERINFNEEEKKGGNEA